MSGLERFNPWILVLIIRKVRKVGGDADPESIVQVLAILKGSRSLESEYPKNAIDRVAQFRIIPRRGCCEIVNKNIFMYPRQSHQRNVCYQKLPELVVKISGEIFIARTVLVIIKQAEATYGIIRDKRCFVTKEMFVIHEIHLIVIEEYSCAQIKIKVSATADF